MGKHSQTKLHHINPDNRGFTLLELVMVLIIFSIFVNTGFDKNPAYRWADIVFAGGNCPNGINQFIKFTVF